MQSNEFSKFLVMWKTYASVINPASVVTDEAALICFKALIEYDFESVKAAIVKVTKRDVFALKVSDVLNELKGGCKTDVEAMGNKAYNSLMSVVEFKGMYHSYIFEDPFIPEVMSILGWDLDKVNRCECDGDFARNNFVKFYTNEVLSGRKPQYRELRSSASGKDCLLVSADKMRYDTPVTWKLSPEDKEIILLGNDQSEAAVKRITAELPKIPQLPEEKKTDTSVPAPIKEQMAALEQTFESFGV